MLAAFADRVAQWPNIAIVLSFSGVMLALLILSRRLGRRFLPRTGEDERASAVLDTFKVLGPLTGVFLSFSLVQSIGQFRAVDVNVAREATNIFQLDRALAGAPATEEARSARLALRDYVRSVVSDEWPALHDGESEPRATVQALNQLHLSVEALVARLPTDARAASDVDKNFDDMQDDRANRLGVAHGGLPDVIWWVLALLFALLFACGACLQGSTARHPLPIVYVTGLGLLAALLFIFDRPFQGDVSIAPAPIVKVLGQMEARLK
ncbi:DUF4239 domain-containing protein [Xanthobacter dioxanivorans]|uniref:DUF4239 domain-containing protein n=1 Tax=Xanthobacter dioxanivorans TaxID=2528964 RepID=A0A974PTZ4_9HYPH|nr:DUF4239 domain-containing protein [Xanthobacter dioxanivorans]QRG09198.1 DUF4239 domain-containing protein [Xanthobacter dioxanivorans]